MVDIFANPKRLYMLSEKRFKFVRALSASNTVNQSSFIAILEKFSPFNTDLHEKGNC